MTTQTRYIPTDHALQRWQERFGSQSIHAALAEAVPYGGNQRKGNRLLISPTLGAVFCVTPDNVIRTVLTEAQAIANMQQNGKHRGQSKWNGVSLSTVTPKHDKKPGYVFVGEVSESWAQTVKDAEKTAVARLTAEHTKDSFHEIPMKERNTYIKEVLRESGVPCSKSVYDDHKSNVLFACYKIWRGETV